MALQPFTSHGVSSIQGPVQITNSGIQLGNIADVFNEAAEDQRRRENKLSLAVFTSSAYDAATEIALNNPIDADEVSRQMASFYDGYVRNDPRRGDADHATDIEATFLKITSSVANNVRKAQKEHINSGIDKTFNTSIETLLKVIEGRPFQENLSDEQRSALYEADAVAHLKILKDYQEVRGEAITDAGIADVMDKFKVSWQVNQIVKEATNMLQHDGVRFLRKEIRRVTQGYPEFAEHLKRANERFKTATLTKTEDDIAALTAAGGELARDSLSEERIESYFQALASILGPAESEKARVAWDASERNEIYLQAITGVVEDNLTENDINQLDLDNSHKIQLKGMVRALDSTLKLERAIEYVVSVDGLGPDAIADLAVSLERGGMNRNNLQKFLSAARKNYNTKFLASASSDIMSSRVTTLLQLESKDYYKGADPAIQAGMRQKLLDALTKNENNDEIVDHHEIISNFQSLDDADEALLGLNATLEKVSSGSRARIRLMYVNALEKWAVSDLKQKNKAAAAAKKEERLSVSNEWGHDILDGIANGELPRNGWETTPAGQAMERTDYNKVRNALRADAAEKAEHVAWVTGGKIGFPPLASQKQIDKAFGTQILTGLQGTSEQVADSMARMLDFNGFIPAKVLHFLKTATSWDEATARKGATIMRSATDLGMKQRILNAVSKTQGSAGSYEMLNTIETAPQQDGDLNDWIKAHRTAPGRANMAAVQRELGIKDANGRTALQNFVTNKLVMMSSDGALGTIAAQFYNFVVKDTWLGQEFALGARLADQTMLSQGNLVGMRLRNSRGTSLAAIFGAGDAEDLQAPDLSQRAMAMLNGLITSTLSEKPNMDMRSTVEYSMDKLSRQMTYDPSFVGASKIQRLDNNGYAIRAEVTYRNPMVVKGWTMMESRGALIQTAKLYYGIMKSNQDISRSAEFKASAKLAGRFFLEEEFSEGVRDPDHGGLSFNKLYNQGRLYWTSEHPTGSGRFGIVLIDDNGNNFRLNRRNSDNDKAKEYTFELPDDIGTNPMRQVKQARDNILKQLVGPD